LTITGRDLGEQGEQQACRYLKLNGYDILHTNWRHGHHEIDIIANYNQVTVIFEVKTRQTDAFGTPDTFVNSKKHRNLFRTAEAYLENNQLSGEVRFDIISIYKENGEWKITHIEDAFYPGA